MTVGIGRLQLHRPGAASQWVFWGYLLVVSVAEVLSAVVHPQLGLIAHAITLIGLLVHAGIGRYDETRKLALALILAPMIRLLSFSLPLLRFPQAAWYPIVSIPLLLATWLIIRHIKVAGYTLGLTRNNLVLQLLLVPGGLGLGVIEYLILRPAPFANSFSWGSFWLLALSLTIFTGFTEELIFRGLLQNLSVPVLGRWGLVYVALLFAVLHTGYQSVLDVVFVFAVGLVFGYIVSWGGSILGVTLAHGLTNITLFLVMPFLAMHPDHPGTLMLPWLVTAGTMLAMVGIGFLLLRSLSGSRTRVTGQDPATTIRATRRNAGLTYTDLACRSGISVRELAVMEHGLEPLPVEQLARISRKITNVLPLPAVGMSELSRDKDDV